MKMMCYTRISQVMFPGEEWDEGRSRSLPRWIVIIIVIIVVVAISIIIIVVVIIIVGVLAIKELPHIILHHPLI